MQSKERILQSAQNLFFNKGYRQTTTKEIASHAMVSEALLFKYYGSKAQLLRLVVRTTLDMFVSSSQVMVDGILSQDLNPEEKLTLLMSNRYDFFMDHFQGTSIIIRQMQFDPVLKASVQSIFDEKIDPILTQVLKAWYRAIHKEFNVNSLSLVKSILFDAILQRALFDKTRAFADVQAQLQIVMKGLSYE